MGRISPGPTRWPPGAERRLVPAKSNLKPQTSNQTTLTSGDRTTAPTRQPQNPQDTARYGTRQAGKHEHEHHTTEQEQHPGAPMGSTGMHRGGPKGPCHRRGCMYIRFARVQLKGRPKRTAKYQMMNCACKDASRAEQGVSYRISNIFSSGRTSCRYLSPPEHRPHHEGATHRHNVPYGPNATGITGTDSTRRPRPNPSNGRTSQPLGGTDDGVPTTVLPTTQQPHARTSGNRAHRETTPLTGNK